MKNPLPVQFIWHVALGGHIWLDTHVISESTRQPFLTHERPQAGGSGRLRTYQPLQEHPALFRTFAETEPTQEGIKRFADQFGMLGSDCSKPIPLYRNHDDRHAPVGSGELAGAWSGEIETMRWMIDLWEQARQGDVEALQPHIRWTEDGNAVAYDSHPDKSTQELMSGQFLWRKDSIAVEGDPVFSFFSQGDIVGPALQQVQAVINRRLKDRVSLRLLWKPHSGQRTLYIVPTGLIGGLWLQFAQAFEQDLHYRRCAVCNSWFELAPGRGRADKLVCSNACRTRAYRQRQEDAVRLHREGRSIEQIAAELQTETDAVRGWIDKARAKPPRAGPRGRPRGS